MHPFLTHPPKYVEHVWKINVYDKNLRGFQSLPFTYTRLQDAREVQRKLPPELHSIIVPCYLL